MSSSCAGLFGILAGRRHGKKAPRAPYSALSLEAKPEASEFFSLLRRLCPLNLAQQPGGSAMSRPLMPLVLAFLPFVPVHLVSGGDAPPVDLVVLNAKIWTVDKKRPEAEALAVVRDRIVFVGSTAEAKKLMGPK